MATSLKLVHEDLSDLTLIAAEDAGLRAQRWIPAMAEISYRHIPDYVVEEIDLRADSDTDDNLAALHQDLELRAAYAEWFWYDRTIYKPLWLYSKLDGETYERRALVKSIHYEFRSNPISEMGLAAVHDTEIRVRIERHPYWESLSNFTASGSTVDGASVRHDPSNTADGEVIGTVPARVEVGFRSATGPHLIDRLWMGIRSEKHGDPDDFLYIWECEDGTLSTDASLTTGATASPGGGGNTNVEVNFASVSGWDDRVRFRVFSMVGVDKWEQQAGRVLELIRAKVDSATECEMRVKIGPHWGPAASYITIGPDVPVTNTNWDYYEMGEAVIPPIDNEGDSWNVLTLDQYAQQTCIEIWARRTSGTGSLYLDCMCPIPLDDGFCFLSDIGINYLTGRAEYYTTERDVGVAWSRESASGLMEYTVVVNDHNFRLPPGETRIIAVYARDTQSVLSDDISILTSFIPRWASLRGSSGYTT